MNKIVTTRQPNLIHYLRKEGLIEDSVELMPRVLPGEVRGKHVFGVIPLHLAAEAELVTEVPLIVPPHLRGKELTLEEIYRYARNPVTYRVNRVRVSLTPDGEVG